VSPEVRICSDVRPHSDDRRLGIILAGLRWCRRQSAKNFRGRSRRRENAFANQRTVDFREPDDDAASLEFAHSLTRSARPILRPSVNQAREPLFSAEEIYGIFSSDPGKQYDMRESSRASWTPENSRNTAPNPVRRCSAAIRASVAGPLDRREPEKHVQTLARARTRSAWNLRRVIYPSRGKGRAIYSRLQPESHPADFSPRRKRLHGRKRRRMERHHSRRSENGQRRGEQPSSKNHRDLRWKFRRRKLAMCGKAYDPRFMFAWPTARFAVMSATPQPARR